MPVSPALLWQSHVAGTLFSALNACQNAVSAERLETASIAGSVVLLGYWRSGTTLLHNYLANDKRFGFPSTYACMNPQHFLLTQAAALAKPQASTRRPMDNVRITALSPQEDEFALLALGARSPYEALLAPRSLAAALALSDPRDLTGDDERRWESIFSRFLRGVSAVEGNRPLILKSPPHGYRVATLRRLIPDARFVVIVRSPDIVFESVVRMWHALFPIYSMAGLPPEDETRGVVLADRPTFEAKLAAGLAGLPENRVAWLQYEELVRDAPGTIGRVYEQLGLDNFASVEAAIKAEAAASTNYVAGNMKPSDYWNLQLRQHWRSIFERYGYEPC